MAFAAELLSLNRGAETGHAADLWRRALESARTSLKVSTVSDEALAALAKESRSPEKFTVLARLLYSHEKTHANAGSIAGVIFLHTNHSPFSLADWIDSLAYFQGWLAAAGRQADLLSMLEYLECSVASPEGQDGGNSLLSVVEDMLKIHGFEG